MPKRYYLSWFYWLSILEECCFCKERKFLPLLCVWLVSLSRFVFLLLFSFHSKKDKLKRRTDSPNEKFLYHGTTSNRVDAICAQNFDFRLHGHNGTNFGKGSYFAKQASYSHKFSTPDHNGFNYMFIAQVLVGEYTQVKFCLWLFST